MIMPHSGDVVSSQINKIALQYNVPLVKADAQYNFDDFAPLYMQAMKQSENGKMTVIRLCETDGRRGSITLSKPVKLLNMLEDELCTVDKIDYKPFEIITIGVEL